VADFQMPPLRHTESGALRRVGFEFEFTGIHVGYVAEIISAIFGGTLEPESTFVRRVRNTRHGDFVAEIDTSILKKKRYEEVLHAIGIRSEDLGGAHLEEFLLKIFSTIVPYEVSTPPIPLDRLEEIETLRQYLLEAGAKGTRTSILYAFGLHLNPELPSRDPHFIQNVLRAFVLLYPWIRKRINVDLTRKLSPYIQPFSHEYARTLLSARYPRPLEEFMFEYLEHNPTRNRPLDLLPVFSLFDIDLVKSKVEDPHLVDCRPAFHYRMPNCLVDEADWRLADEWNTWVAIEELACDDERLAEMSREYLEAEEHSFRPFFDKWPSVLEQYVR
jgi:hypothetical protein